MSGLLTFRPLSARSRAAERPRQATAGCATWPGF